jgi:hypothetical protein
LQNGEVDLGEFEAWWAAHYSDEGYLTSDGEDSDTA